MIRSLEAVLIGRVTPFGAQGEPSGIAKQPVDNVIAVGMLGLQGDEQADLVHHGGTDKAIHHYPRDHYDFWQSELGTHPLLECPGAFGENISTSGLIEDEICLGDRLRLGTAVVEVSQGRQPCWKLGHRLGDSAVPAKMVMTARSGWYYRVLEPGRVRAGDTLELVERPLPQWTVKLVFQLLIGGHGKAQARKVEELAAIPMLAESWRLRALKLAASAR